MINIYQNELKNFCISIFSSSPNLCFPILCEVSHQIMLHYLAIEFRHQSSLTDECVFLVDHKQSNQLSILFKNLFWGKSQFALSWAHVTLSPIYFFKGYKAKWCNGRRSKSRLYSNWNKSLKNSKLKKLEATIFMEVKLDRSSNCLDNLKQTHIN